jgi:hypothetical protein
MVSCSCIAGGDIGECSSPSLFFRRWEYGVAGSRIVFGTLGILCLCHICHIALIEMMQERTSPMARAVPSVVWETTLLLFRNLAVRGFLYEEV